MTEVKEALIVSPAFYKEVITGDKKRTETILINSISVQDIINKNPELSYMINEKYYAYGVIDFDIDVEFEFDVEVVGQKITFKSDGLELGQRPIRINDVLNISLQVVIPVNYESNTTGEKKKNFFMLDLNPTPGHYYSTADVDGFPEIPIIDRTYLGANRERPSQELLAKTITLYMIPYHIRRVTDHVVIGGTQRDEVLAHTDRQGYFDPSHPEYDPTLLPLALMSAQSPFNSEDIIALDTRKRGGGIKEEVSLQDIKAMHKPSLFNWDIGFFDGEAYQENGVFVLRVPETRFIKMSEKEREVEKKRIEKAIDKFKAFGVLPIIEYFEEGDVAYGEILHNPEFDDPDEPHIGYYNESLSSGDYKIEYRDLDAGDNMVLTMKDNAVYAISVPGFRLDAEKTYTLQIKVIKEDKEVTDRSIAKLTYIYEDGDEVIQMKKASSLSWQRIDETIINKGKLKELLIEINKSDDLIYGTIFIDYISIKEADMGVNEERETIIIENI